MLVATAIVTGANVLRKQTIVRTTKLFVHFFVLFSPQGKSSPAPAKGMRHALVHQLLLILMDAQHTVIKTVTGMRAGPARREVKSERQRQTYRVPPSKCVGIDFASCAGSNLQSDKRAQLQIVTLPAYSLRRRTRQIEFLSTLPAHDFNFVREFVVFQLLSHVRKKGDREVFQA